ncbi:hypothetical protein ACTS9C_05385 [Empedobacter brevis]
MKLVGMTDFVCQHLDSGYDKNDALQNNMLMLKYAKFLKQNLNLGMFVPTDEEGNVLEEPDASNWDIWKGEFEKRKQIYQQAKERVLFEGFEIKVSNITNNLQNDFLIISETNEIIGHENKDQWFFNPYKKVEDLINYDLTLTETAIKQIGL